ncbi:tripartite tricarboxylate transporter TctB family protein [Spiractinospora alimapuensis]|nr:tripartite tricarboxylate transporter TctB family protein [Spiractinospora alimapuensis]
MFLLYTIPLSAEAAAWPWAVLALLLGLGVAIAVRGLRAARARADSSEAPESSTEWSRATLSRPAWTIVIVTAYVGLLSLVGFFPATALYLVAHLWFGGVRDWRVFTGVTVVLSGLVYLLFVAQLSVPLPTGLLFG